MLLPLCLWGSQSEVVCIFLEEYSSDTCRINYISWISCTWQLHVCAKCTEVYLCQLLTLAWENSVCLWKGCPSFAMVIVECLEKSFLEQIPHYAVVNYSKKQRLFWVVFFYFSCYLHSSGPQHPLSETDFVSIIILTYNITLKQSSAVDKRPRIVGLVGPCINLVSV